MVIDAGRKAGYQQQQPELCAARSPAGTFASRPGIVGRCMLSSLPLLQELAGPPCAVTCDESTYSFLLPAGSPILFHRACMPALTRQMPLCCARHRALPAAAAIQSCIVRFTGLHSFTTWGFSHTLLASATSSGSWTPGTLPDSWRQMTKLQMLWMSGCGLRGTLPASWGTGFPSLFELRLRFNAIGGDAARGPASRPPAAASPTSASMLLQCECRWSPPLCSIRALRRKVCHGWG